MPDKTFNFLPIRDKVALPFISGVLGTLVMYAIGIPLYFLKATKLIYLFYDVELFITPQLARSVPGFILGFVTGLVVGGGLAFGFKLIIEWTGSDWIWLKSLAFGAIMWFFWVGVARNFLKITPYLFTDIKTNVILLTQSLIFSVATTYFMVKLAGDKKQLENNED